MIYMRGRRKENRRTTFFLGTRVGWSSESKMIPANLNLNGLNSHGKLRAADAVDSSKGRKIRTHLSRPALNIE